MFIQHVTQVDVEYSIPKLSTTTVMVDSDVTRSISKFVFMSSDVENGYRYKITAKPETEIMFGDCLQVVGTVSIPAVKKVDPNDETLPLYNFPYREYLAKDDVYLLQNAKHIEKVSGCKSLSQYSKLQLFFIRQKDRLTEIFLKRYEQPYAGLVAGVLVAGKGLLDKDSLELFKRTSLSHVVVLSGSNVSLILVCIKMLVDFLFIWKKEKGGGVKFTQKVIIIIAVWAFVLLTGGGAPIYRAVVSAYCGLFLFQEKTSQVYALTVVIFIMTVINPFQTLYDPSFHLTCCATYGLILFSKPIDSRMRLSRLRFIPSWLREIISVTLATQVFVFPYIMFMTASFSSVFLLSNVTVLPIIPFVMMFGFATLCGELFELNFLTAISVYINNILLHTIFYIVKILSEIPHAYIQITKTTSTWVLVAYAVLMTAIVIFSQRLKS
ncbi:MAG: ComEC/Rec2 family competence protein [Patescibacteria group bacterium]